MENKDARKGISKNIPLTIDAFREVLFNETGEKHKIITESLRCDRDKNMTRMRCIKSGLSDLYTKHYVESDGVTCTPLRIKEKYL